MMGMDPVTIGLGASAIGSLYGAWSGNKAQQKAQDQSQQNYQQQQQNYADQTQYLRGRNAQIDSLGGSFLGQQNPYADNINQFVYGQPNAGQDGMMQQMRAGTGLTYQGSPSMDQTLSKVSQNGFTDPTALATYQQFAKGNTGFDGSPLYATMRAQAGQDLNDQIYAQRGAAGSIGQRFGSANLNNEAQLRARALVGLNANEAQVGQQSYEASMARQGQGAAGLLGQAQASTAAQLQAAGLQQQGNQFQNQFNLQNQNQQATQQQGWGSLIASMLGQQQQGYLTQRGQNAGVIGAMAGMPTGVGMQSPQQQIIPGQNQLPGAISDVGNMAMLYPFLRQMMSGQQGGAPQTAPIQGYNYGMPSNFFG